MSIPTIDEWICCFSCKSKFAPFNCRIKELSAHCSEENTWVLLRQNSQMKNVRFFNKAASRIRDEGETTLTDIARMHCSNCDAHLGGKLVYVEDRHPVIRTGQYVLQIRKNP